jgi:hypothetical protein
MLPFFKMFRVSWDIFLSKLNLIFDQMHMIEDVEVVVPTMSLGWYLGLISLNWWFPIYFGCAGRSSKVCLQEPTSKWIRSKNMLSSYLQSEGLPGSPRCLMSWPDAKQACSTCFSRAWHQRSLVGFNNHFLGVSISKVAFAVSTPPLLKKNSDFFNFNP